MENIEENHLYLEKVDAIISNYYEKQVHLGKDKYNSTVDIFDITEQEQHTYVANLYIRCGFIQHEDHVSTGNTEHDDKLRAVKCCNFFTQSQSKTGATKFS